MHFSKATYKRRFKGQGFNIKQTTLSNNPTLVKEVRQLWYKNVTSKEMLYILQKNSKYSTISVDILKRTRLINEL